MFHKIPLNQEQNAATVHVPVVASYACTCRSFTHSAKYFSVYMLYSNMMCSKQTKQMASHVAIAIYMQPVKLCRSILYKSRSVAIPQTVNTVPFPVEEDSIIFKHELICETILDNHHMIPFYLKIYTIIQNT